MSQKSILEILSKNLNSYQSTKWLKTENETLDGSTPAELMLEDDVDKIIEILPEEIERIKSAKINKNLQAQKLTVSSDPHSYACGVTYVYI